MGSGLAMTHFSILAYMIARPDPICLAVIGPITAAETRWDIKGMGSG